MNQRYIPLSALLRQRASSTVYIQRQHGRIVKQTRRHMTAQEAAA